MFADSPSGLEKARSCLAGFGSAGRRLLAESRSKAARHAHVVLSGDEAVCAALTSLEGLNWEDRGANLAARVERAGLALEEAVVERAGVYSGSPVAGLVREQLVIWVARELERMAGARRKLSVDCGVALEGLVQHLMQAMRPFCQPAELRAAFTRVKHMMTVLAVEAPADLSELWDSSWPLSTTEVRVLTSKRIDFSAKDVASLKFKEK